MTNYVTHALLQTISTTQKAHNALGQMYSITMQRFMNRDYATIVSGNIMHQYKNQETLNVPFPIYSAVCYGTEICIT